MIRDESKTRVETTGVAGRWDTGVIGTVLSLIGTVIIPATGGRKQSADYLMSLSLVSRDHYWGSTGKAVLPCECELKYPCKGEGGCPIMLAAHGMFALPTGGMDAMGASF